ERQRGNVGGAPPGGALHLDCRAWLMAAATHVRQGDCRTQPRRDYRRADLAYLVAVAPDFGATGNDVPARYLQTAQQAVEVARITGHDDRFLAEVATLGVTDRPVAPHFDDEAIRIDVHAVDRCAGLDAKEFVGRQPGGRGPGLDQETPDFLRLAARAD